MKKCPYCAEEIQDEAIKCKHCGQFLAELQPAKKTATWFYSNTALVVGFLCVGPLILPLVWLNPRFTRVTKILLTVVMILITWALTLGMVRLTSFLLDMLQKNYDLLKSSGY